MPSVRDRVRTAVPAGLAALGIAGCVLCCALPLLLTAGVVTGSAAAFLADRVPPAAVGLLAVAAFGWWAFRGRCTSCADVSRRGDAAEADVNCGGCTCGDRRSGLARRLPRVRPVPRR